MSPPPASDRKAICLPSGEKRAWCSQAMEWVSGWDDDHRTRPGEGNVELVRAIPASASAAVTAASAAAPDRIESLTTLAGP